MLTTDQTWFKMSEHLFITNAWCIPIVTLVLVYILKSLFLAKHRFLIGAIIPFYCIAISAGMHAFLPPIDNMEVINWTTLISNILFDAAMATFLYESYINIKNYIHYRYLHKTFQKITE